MSERVSTGNQTDPIDTSSDNSLVGNYPPPGDTTSQGGYRQRPPSPSQKQQTPDLGLANGQSYEGLSLENQGQDAKQGVDGGAREAMQQEQGLNPYGNASTETPQEAADRLASQYSDSRGRQYLSGPAASSENDGSVD